MTKWLDWIWYLWIPDVFLLLSFWIPNRKSLKPLRLSCFSSNAHSVSYYGRQVTLNFSSIICKKGITPLSKCHANLNHTLKHLKLSLAQSRHSANYCRFFYLNNWIYGEADKFIKEEVRSYITHFSTLTSPWKVGFGRHFISK